MVTSKTFSSIAVASLVRVSSFLPNQIVAKKGSYCQQGFVIFVIPSSSQELPDGAKLLIFLFRFVINAVKRVNI